MSRLLVDGDAPFSFLFSSSRPPILHPIHTPPHTQDFRSKRHDLLDQHNGKFDRDYGDFNMRIAELEAALQGFINQVCVCVRPSRVHVHQERPSLKDDLANP